MCAAAWLEINAFDGDGPDRMSVHRGLYGHGANKFRIGLEFGHRDFTVINIRVARDQFIEFLADLILIKRRVGQIEIKSCLVGGDVAAGYIALDDRAEKMQAGMEAHQLVAIVPIKLSRDRVANRRQGVIIGNDVQDASCFAVLDCRGDGQGGAIPKCERANVA